MPDPDSRANVSMSGDRKSTTLGPGEATASGAEAVEALWLPTGARGATLSRRTYMGNGSPLVTARLTVSRLWLPAGPVASATFVSNAQAAVTPTNQWAALYSDAGALVGTSADQTTAAWASFAEKAFLFSGLTLGYSGFYYLGLMVAAATVPSLSASGASGADISYLKAPALCGRDAATGLTNPASAPATLGTLAGVPAIPYAYVS